MTKGNNLGDTSKLYLTLHEMNSLLLENFKLGWVGGRKFYRIKRNKEVRGEPELASCLGNCLSDQAEHFPGTKSLSKYWLADMALCAEAASSWVKKLIFISTLHRKNNVKLYVHRWWQLGRRGKHVPSSFYQEKWFITVRNLIKMLEVHKIHFINYKM